MQMVRDRVREENEAYKKQNASLLEQLKETVESADEWFYDASCIEYRLARDAYEVSKGFIRVRADHPVRGIGWA